MRAVANISDIFPKYLFWDVEYKNIDVEADKDFIIPRALFATTEQTFDQDIARLEKLYSRNQIVQELKRTKERISNQVCKLVARRYHIRQFTRFK